MQKLFGVPIDQLLIVLTAVFVAGVLVLGVVALRNRVAFKLAVRNIPRRRAQTSLIILGLMLATLLFSAAFATGDTLSNTIRHQALDEIGQTDVLVRSESADEAGRRGYFSADVVDEIRAVVAGAEEVEAVVPSIREELPAYTPRTGLSEAQVVVLGLPAQGPGIGSFEESTGTPLQVASLSADQTYLSTEAADRLEAEVGDEVQIFPGAEPRSLTVAGIYERGTHPAGSVSLVVPLSATQEFFNAPDSINQVLISNQGDELTGARHTDRVLELVEPAIAGTGLEVAPIKQDALDEADAAGAGFSTIFLLFAQFSVAAGILLIFLIFVMLAAERKHELGIARAVGAQRGHVIRMFTFEGAIYAGLAAAVGSLLGVLVGYGMVFILRTAFGQVDQETGTLDLVFAFNWKSLVIAFTLGVVLTFFVVLVSSWRVSRMNVVRAIRDIPEPRIPRRGWRSLVTGIVLPTLGLVVAASGFRSGQMGPFMLGVSLIIIGIPLLGRRFGLPDRATFTLAGAGLLAWWLMPTSVLQGLAEEMEQGIEMFFISGIMLVIGGVWVVIYNSDLLLDGVVSVLGRVKGAPPVLKTAISYPMQNRFRTGMTLAMFSLIVFTLVVMSFIIAGLGQIFSNQEALSGGYDVRASTGFLNPIEDMEAALRAQPGQDAETGTIPPESGVRDVALTPDDFTAIASLSTSIVEAKPAGSGIKHEEIAVQGADEGFVESVGYGLALRAQDYESDRAAWQALAAQPDTAIIPAPLVPTRADYSQGAPEPPFRFEGFYLQDDILPDISLSVTDPESGVTRNLRVIGVTDSTAIYAGTVIVSRDTLSTIAREDVPPTSFWFELAEGRDADEIAKALERRFLANGMQAVDTGQEIEDFAAANVMINNLLQGFMALGLVVGIAALGVIAARSVVERRQEIGVMRAIGFQRHMVRNSFLLESSFVALLGIGIGVALGFGLSPQIINTMAEDFPGLEMVVPWRTILLVVAVAYMAAVLTTLYPARQAARVYPAEALRYE